MQKEGLHENTRVSLGSAFIDIRELLGHPRSLEISEWCTMFLPYRNAKDATYWTYGMHMTQLDELRETKKTLA
jgi:hypothetical protein